MNLGELGEKGDGLSGPPMRGVAHLGEPLRLGEGRLCLGEPATVRGLCLGSVFWPGL